MATMIPDDIEEFSSDGEKLFYRFLAAVAKPDEQYLGWYAPDVNEAEPDFVLYNSEVGLVVFEVKDWLIDQIREATPKKFLVSFGAKERSCANPHEQARGYFFKIIDRLVKDGKLLSRDAATFGKPKIPISISVVLPNINKHEYQQRFGDEVIPIGKIFFWDDLNGYSELHEPTGRRFAEFLRERFQPKFPCHLSTGELNHLRQLLYPAIRIQVVERGPDPCQQSHDMLVRLLDHQQEVIARKFDRGHRIVSGPSGSGKTLVLVHQAVFLQKYNPAVKRILFLCYNAALVNYLRRLLAMQGVPLGLQGVEVLTFYELCARLTGEEILHERQDLAYYDTVIDLALEQKVEPERMYDAILVDEGQDFSDRMLQVIMMCLNRKTDVLTIALDEGQDVYRTKRSWSSAGIQVKGRVKRLGMVYRSTREIAEFAARFRSNGQPVQEATGGGQLRLFPDPRIVEGPRPEMQWFSSQAEIVSAVTRQIRSMADAGTFPLSDIGVIYTRKNIGTDQDMSLPQMLSNALDQQGLMSKWLAEDYRAKRSHDITTDSVAITTIHSAKGLDYGCVFLLGVDLLQPDDRWSEEQIVNMVYVGITRARYQLIIPYVEETPLVSRLKAALSA